MFLTNDQYIAASKAIFDSRLAAFRELMSIAVQGTEKIVALNMAVTKASSDDAMAAAKGLMTASDPQAFFSLATAGVQPHTEKGADYSRQWTDIVSATKVELTQVVDAQVADAQSKVSAWVEGFAKNAPADSENVMAILKSSVANAHAGYAQMHLVTNQAVASTQAEVDKASDHLTQVVRKVAAK